MNLRVPPFYGITRIDVDGNRRAVHAYRVSIRKRNKNYIKYFTDAACGGKRKALYEAKKFRDEIMRKARPFTRAELSKSARTKNKSGIVGVSLIETIDKRKKNIHRYLYWKAWWSPEVGKPKSKMFSVNKYGYRKAFHLAKQARQNGLKEMKEYDLSFIKLSLQRSRANIY
jgi:hypothetical protein